MNGTWSVMGQVRRFSNVRVRSAFPLIATIERTSPFGREVPIATKRTYSKSTSWWPLLEAACDELLRQFVIIRTTWG